jgi:tetratricopeptide (TPR) repeat protein
VRLFQEDLDAEEAEEKAEDVRRADRRKKAAASARNIAALARANDVAKALIYYKRAVNLDPGDAETWNAYARVAEDAGRTDEAKAAFEQAALKAVGDGVGEARYSAANGRGDIALAQGSLPEALRFYRSAQETMDRLAKADPNAGWQRDLSVSYSKVGDVLVAQGNLPEAMKSFQGSLAIADRLAKADPNNTGWQRDLSVVSVM